ncbi:MAG: 3-methylitaconate isomerase [Clostridiales bacterium]|nr:3-methylitaconate isomerase [Clostridiales bacterium]
MSESRQEQRKIPCVYMRGGTSKAVVFHEEDLPENRNEWDEIFLKVMGTPDAKQIDGMGGTVSSTSKIAVIKRSERPGADVDYTFCQVNIAIPVADFKANCGNISSTVGPFAIDEGLVKAVEPVTEVRVYNTNTNKMIIERVRVKNGHACMYGDERIQGVPGTGSRIDEYFMDPAGAVTGKLFPTGKKEEVIDVPDYGKTRVTVIDSGNVVVFIPAVELGLQGTELQELNQQKDVLERIERIRGMVAQKLGFVERWEDARVQSSTVPEVSIVSEPQDYVNLDGNQVKAEEMDLCVRSISVGQVHRAYPITGATGTGSAAKIPGTVVAEALRPGCGKVVRLGHSSGILSVEVDTNKDRIVSVGVSRTARRIMDGNVYIRD